ncbi:hypothetical protein BC833DRAFT_599888 [Globomyces pollinis-pini]|nr:hypothetical protein BC833DRAFT_599888 [Globomyces pollinis-pini]
MVSLVVMGTIQFLLGPFVFAAGNGSVLDIWNRITSPLTIGMSQLICLIIGLYMIVLMKGVCVIKDHQTKINYEKYLKYSYGLLILYNTLILMAVISYAIGVTVRGPNGTSNSNVSSGLGCFGAISASSQVVVLGFLFECIKSMKFGSDMQRIRKSTIK